MTQVDFYILQDVEIDARHRFACRLASKAVSSGLQVVVYAEDEKIASQLDELLWRYPAQRFIPHGLISSQDAERAPEDIRCSTMTSMTGRLPEPLCYERSEPFQK